MLFYLSRSYRSWGGKEGKQVLTAQEYHRTKSDVKSSVMCVLLSVHYEEYSILMFFESQNLGISMLKLIELQQVSPTSNDPSSLTFSLPRKEPTSSRSPPSSSPASSSYIFTPRPVPSNKQAAMLQWSRHLTSTVLQTQATETPEDVCMFDVLTRVKQVSRRSWVRNPLAATHLSC